MEGPQLLNLGRQDQVLDAAVRAQVDALAIGRKPGKLRHLEPLGFVRTDQIGTPPRHLGFVRAHDQLGGWRARQGDRAIAAINGPSLRHILKADHHREAALASARDELFDLGLIPEGRQFVGDNPDLLAANLRAHQPAHEAVQPKVLQRFDCFADVFFTWEEDPALSPLGPFARAPASRRLLQRWQVVTRLERVRDRRHDPGTLVVGLRIDDRVGAGAGEPRVQFLTW